MPTATLELVSGLSGRRVAVVREADGLMTRLVALPAATAAMSWTKSTATSGSAALPEGHPISSGETVAVVWQGGSRREMTAAVNGQTVSVSGGTGDNLPDSGAAVLIARRTVIEFDQLGSDIELIELSGFVEHRPGRLIAALRSESAEEYVADIDGMALWFSRSGLANPLASKTLKYIHAYAGESETTTLFAGCLEDSTPGT